MTDVDLLLLALRREGRTPLVLARSDRHAIAAVESAGIDHVVVSDATFKAWQAEHRPEPDEPDPPDPFPPHWAPAWREHLDAAPGIIARRT